MAMSSSMMNNSNSNDMSDEDNDRDIDIESDDDDNDDTGSQNGRAGGPNSTQHFSQAEKRAHHNALERKRRDHIKDSFNSLRESVPALAGDKSIALDAQGNQRQSKASRAQILRKAAEFIQFMRRKNQAQTVSVEDLKRQNNILDQQIRQLEMARDRLKNTDLGQQLPQQQQQQQLEVAESEGEGVDDEMDEDVVLEDDDEDDDEDVDVDDAQLMEQLVNELVEEDDQEDEEDEEEDDEEDDDVEVADIGYAHNPSNANMH